jgi:SAM-dependent methyltransferase
VEDTARAALRRLRPLLAVTAGVLVVGGAWGRHRLRRQSARSVATLRKLLLAAVSVPERVRLWLLCQPWFVGVLLPALPRQLRYFLRWVYLAPVDLADRLLGRRQTDVPPKAATFTGAVQDFAASGQSLLEALVDVAGVTSSSQVLDVGCGLGRLGRPMSHFLDPSGGYEGLDIVPDGIRWCKQHIVSPHDNVHFTLADIYNKEYNPKGRLRAAEYRFPYEDETFDAAVLVSVFTHMLPDEVDRYISEIARVVKKGGRVFATYHLLNPESIRMMDLPPAEWRFKHHVGPYWTTSLKVPELSVGYDESYIRDLYAMHGLSGEPDIYVGSWCGRASHWPSRSQDTVVAAKL